jgi:hypothetical protein
MDHKQFKAHLKVLAERYHHPEEHDWHNESAAKVAHASGQGRKPLESTAAKSKTGRRETARTITKR